MTELKQERLEDKVNESNRDKVRKQQKTVDYISGVLGANLLLLSLPEMVALKYITGCEYSDAAMLPVLNALAVYTTSFISWIYEGAAIMKKD
jgi:hypothetical protein